MIAIIGLCLWVNMALGADSKREWIEAENRTRVFRSVLLGAIDFLHAEKLTPDQRERLLQMSMENELNPLDVSDQARFTVSLEDHYKKLVAIAGADLVPRFYNNVLGDLYEDRCKNAVELLGVSWDEDWSNAYHDTLFPVSHKDDKPYSVAELNDQIKADAVVRDMERWCERLKTDLANVTDSKKQERDAYIQGVQSTISKLKADEAIIGRIGLRLLQP